MPAISAKPLDIQFVTFDHLNKNSDGTVTASYRDGTVISVQPDGSIQSRPAGSNGAYERAIVAGDKIIYRPVHLPLVFAYLALLP